MCRKYRTRLSHSNTIAMATVHMSQCCTAPQHLAKHLQSHAGQKERVLLAIALLHGRSFGPVCFAPALHLLSCGNYLVFFSFCAIYASLPLHSLVHVFIKAESMNVQTHANCH